MRRGAGIVMAGVAVVAAGAVVSGDGGERPVRALPAPDGIAVTAASVREADGRAVIVVRRGARAPDCLRWAVEDGTARRGLDFEQRSGTVQFTLGDRVRTVAVPVRADEAGEGTETFRVRFAPAYGERGGSATATVRLLDGS